MLKRGSLFFHCPCVYLDVDSLQATLFTKLFGSGVLDIFLRAFSCCYQNTEHKISLWNVIFSSEMRENRATGITQPTVKPMYL